MGLWEQYSKYVINIPGEDAYSYSENRKDLLLHTPTEKILRDEIVNIHKKLYKSKESVGKTTDQEHGAQPEVAVESETVKKNGIEEESSKDGDSKSVEKKERSVTEEEGEEDLLRGMRQMQWLDNFYPVPVFVHNIVKIFEVCLSLFASVLIVATCQANSPFAEEKTLSWTNL